ncbi:MAG TPA: histidine--tRNA ligase [Gemmatimonadaceae bacterium]|nr:histidine--tRNA ligase [Gemmatimonadaceae bacterium]
MASIRPLNGFRDFYPAAFAERAHIFATWRRVAARYGFVEYDGPPLEPLELYTKKSGAEIVDQLYNFVDKGGRDVSLRPEMTPTVSRMVAAQANALRKPVRWFSIPQLFRYERAQRGRLREHFQLNADIFGDGGESTDAELLALVIDILREFGLTGDDVRVRLSDRRLLNVVLRTLQHPDDRFPAIYAVLDKLDRQPRETSVEKLLAAGCTPPQVDELLALIEATQAQGISALTSVLRDGEGAARLIAIQETLSMTESLIGTAVAPWVRIDLTIVRGLAYYTGIVFEVFDAKGELRAVCGGGRYDELLKALGGVDMPAAGFGWGDVVLGELLRDRGLLPSAPPSPEFWVAATDDVDAATIRQTVGVLRRAGRRVEYALRPQQLGKQLKAAVSAGAAHALILRGEASGEGTLRDLTSGEETSVVLATWLAGQQ